MKRFRIFPDPRKWCLLLQDSLAPLRSLLSDVPIETDNLLTCFIKPTCIFNICARVSFIDADFHNTSTILSSFSVSIFVPGFVVCIYPFSELMRIHFLLHLRLARFSFHLSEIYGRQPVLNYANCFLVVWNLGCALAPNLASPLVMRFLVGVGCSACLTIGGGVIVLTGRSGVRTEALEPLYIQEVGESQAPLI
jgi:MFS family permease